MATRIDRNTYKWLKANTKRNVFGPFECPNCGNNLFFKIDKSSQKVLTKCECGIKGEWESSETLQPVDYYNKLVEDHNSND